MIIGFGNNVISSLAADITASQTTIQVMPGAGARFAGLLTYDYANSSNILKTYAKITLTDAKETVFEVCHLTAVNNDMLTVVRGQEGTTAKGWSLNDVIANFATRGSENQFVQIEQLQSGHYTSAVAGGTPNALTLELPATYFLNGSTDWVLRSPIIVYPSQNNTGASTLQLTMGGRVLGTFPLYKGNKAALVANDILKDVALVCLMDNTKAFFSVANPGAIYAGLGTAAFRDAQTSVTDATAGRLMQVGAFGVGATSTTKLEDCNASVPGGFYYGFGNGTASPTLNCPPDAGNSTLTFFVASGNTVTHFICLENTSNGVNAWFGERYSGQIKWTRAYTTLYKPTATDTGALPLTGGTVTGPTTFQQDVTVGGDIVNNSRSFITKSGFGDVVNNTRITNGLRVKGVADLAGELYFLERVNQHHLIGFHVTGAGVNQWFEFRSTGETILPGKVISAGGASFGGNVTISHNGGSATYQENGDVNGPVWGGYLSNYINNIKNTANKNFNGWFKDSVTGVIIQWGAFSANRGDWITYPIQFPSYCAAINITDTGGNGNAGGAEGRTNVGFVLKPNQPSLAATYIAIGY